MPDDATPVDSIGTHASPRRAEPDAHGQAALLLAESMLHTLVEAKALTLRQASDAVRTATEVKVEVAEEMHESGARMRHSLRLLEAIGQSLAVAGADAANDA